MSQPCYRRASLASLLLAPAAIGLFTLLASAGCGNSGNDPHNLTPAQQQNIQDELESEERLKDQPPI